MMKAKSSNTQISLGKLATTLIVTALCSQALPVGLNLLISAGIENMGYGGPSAIAQSNFDGLLALALILAGPFLFGLYLKPSWSGLGIGFLGLAGEVAGYLFFALISALISPLFAAIGALLLLFPGLVGILVMLWVAGKIKSSQERRGLGIGIVIGTGASVGLVVLVTIFQVLVKSTQGPSGHLLIFLSFLWTWLGAVFFPEFISHRTDRRGLVIWIAVMLTSTSVIATIVFNVFRGPGF